MAEIEAFLRRTGYGLDMLVDEPGEAAVHGHVVDIFPAGALGPVRIEHEDGRVTRIDSYDPATQRTLRRAAGDRARRGVRIHSGGRDGAG